MHKNEKFGNNNLLMIATWMISEISKMILLLDPVNIQS